MELTRFDLKNQVIQARIAAALERIATVLEKLTPTDDDEMVCRLKPLNKEKGAT